MGKNDKKHGKDARSGEASSGGHHPAKAHGNPASVDTSLPGVSASDHRKYPHDTAQRNLSLRAGRKQSYAQETSASSTLLDTGRSRRDELSYPYRRQC